MRSNRFRAVLIGVLLAWPIAFATADDPQPTSRPATQPATRPAALSAAQLAQFEKLIDRMRDSSFDKREAADAAIRKMGVPVLPVIRKYIDDDDPEVALRAEQIIEFLDRQIPVQAKELRLSLTTDKKELKVRSRTGFKVTLTNDSRKTTGYKQSGAGSATQARCFVLKGPDGERIWPLLQKKGRPSRDGQLQPHGKCIFMFHTTINATAPAGLQPIPGLKTSASRPATKTKPFAWLIFRDGTYHFPLPRPGVYSVLMRVYPATEAISTPSFNVLPFTGILESNKVEFKLVK